MRPVQLIGAAALACLAASGAAQAAIIVDGSYDADYGAARSVVTYDPAAPTSNFDAPTPFTNAIGYSIYLSAQSGNVYGLLKAAGPGASVGPFANLYFDLDPANGNGSDLGFEITNHDAFIPGVPGSVALSNISVATSSDGLGVEFAIPYADFTGPIAGLSYYDGQAFPGAGDPITLRLSQSFGYSVAGGALYGPNRLGSVTLGEVSAVPLPAALPMFGVALVGLAAAGYRAKRAKASSAT